jgi:uncharacterized protein
MKQKIILLGLVITATTITAQSITKHNTPTKQPSNIAVTNIDVFDVARKGTLTELKSLMAIKKDTINAVSAHGFSPLLLACYRGNTEVASFLIDEVKQVDIITKEGTPLTACVYKGDLLLAEKLLKKGANPNIADDNGSTCLIMAAQINNIDMVKLLLRYKADKTIKDKQGKTAADYALFTNNTAFIDLLK